MKHTLLMVDVRHADGTVEAEPLEVESDGRIGLLTLDDGTRITAPAASLVAALAGELDDIRRAA